MDNDPVRLSQTAKSICEDSANELVLSIASVWEMQIKLQLGKLTLRLPLSELIRDQQKTNALQILPISLDHVLSLDALPPNHRDPFDRLLIAQANAEGINLLSADPIFGSYKVK